MGVKALGVHLIVEFYGCNSSTLNDLCGIEDIMIRAALETGAEIREVAFHRFYPQGVSGVVVIAESHLSIHTWPECGYAAVDIYTCGETTIPQKGMEYIEGRLEATKTEVQILHRGNQGMIDKYPAHHSEIFSQKGVINILEPAT